MANAHVRRLSPLLDRLDLVAVAMVIDAAFSVLERERQRLDDHSGRLAAAGERRHSVAREALAALSGRLDGLSPLGVLSRGYSVTMPAKGARVAIRDVSDLKPGDVIRTRFASGEADSAVTEVRNEGSS